ncbi:MAG: 2-phospho-L-lactate guanylyltransferase, partial [Thiotrichales bacterium]|nr:2-phospho-L-lactate guanylyltransferase [Thiotrichales bacterium]
MWAVVPVKDMAGAKQRLSPALDAAERQALFRAMLEDVLDALALVRGLAGIAIVTHDPEAEALAAAHGARVIVAPANRGHRAAVATAAEVLTGEGAEGLVQVPGDVPLATAEELEAVLAAHGPAPAVTLVPSHDAQGTNCLAASPPDAVPFLFGDVSFAPHQ